MKSWFLIIMGIVDSIISDLIMIFLFVSAVVLIFLGKPQSAMVFAILFVGLRIKLRSE